MTRPGPSSFEARPSAERLRMTAMETYFAQCERCAIQQQDVLRDFFFAGLDPAIQLPFF